MKKIIMSDLHLGQNGLDGSGNYSLLSDIPSHLYKEKEKADAKMNILKSRVKLFAGKDPIALICCGDTLDLSLAYFDQAYHDLEYLLKNIPSITSLVLVVGNHDHHLWTMHCEYKNIIAPLMHGNSLCRAGIYQPTQGDVFELFEKNLSGRLGRDIMVDIAYPSYSFQIEDETFYCTHGHLFGGLYNLVSRIMSIFLEEEVDEGKHATMNVALIELIYWLCGETGEGMGANGIIEALHADAEKGDDSLIKQIVSKGVDEILPEGIIRGIPDSWERNFVKWAIGKFVDKTLEEKPAIVISKDRYEDPAQTIKRVEGWMTSILKINKEEKLSFIFGHTHRSGMANIGNVYVYNLGSWLVESKDDDPDTEILTIGDDGSVVMEKL